MKLVEVLCEKSLGGGVEGLIYEFLLLSQEGVVLMCFVEVLLCILDCVMCDVLICDKISKGDWCLYVGYVLLLFVNVVIWGLMIIGKFVMINSEVGLLLVFMCLIGCGGELLICKGVDMVMCLMGEQFVIGEMIFEVFVNSCKYEVCGFCYLYDMFGEVVIIEEDVQCYYVLYEQVIYVIGKVVGGCGIYEGLGILIKLLVLYVCYLCLQQDCMMSELLLCVCVFVLFVCCYDIGLNIDVEEVDCFELLFDLFEVLCFDLEFVGWNGIGFVVQGYQKCCLFVIDYLIDFVCCSCYCLMICFVKGVYWDIEIKWVQVDGFEGYLVYMCKIYIDVLYFVCVKKLFVVLDVVYLQFVMYNVYMLVVIY